VSIRDLQIRSFKERIFGTEFKKKDGSDYSIDFEKLVRAYGVEYSLATTPEDFGMSLENALRMDAPMVVEAMVERTYPLSGTKAFGFWDIPSPYRA
jgi:acetolactate synthase-1/2/3 large subunit